RDPVSLRRSGALHREPQRIGSGARRRDHAHMGVTLRRPGEARFRLCHRALQSLAMTRAPLHRLAFLRQVLAAVVVLDLFLFPFFLRDVRLAALASGVAFSSFADLLSKTPVRWLVSLTGIVAAVMFALQPGRLWHGAIALGALALLSTAHAQLFGSPWRHQYFSGLCLLGGLLGLGVSRSRGAPTAESYAPIGRIAFLCASDLNRGISQLPY